MKQSSNDNVFILLSLGSNIGDSRNILENAIGILNEIVFDMQPEISSFYQTEPVGFSDQPWFLNISVSGYTNLDFRELIYIFKSIEYLSGRKKSQKWHERELDIDLIFYGDISINNPKLILPHPFMHLRKFVLLPSSEIAGEFVHPLIGKNVNTLLNECTDNSIVRKIVN